MKPLRTQSQSQGLNLIKLSWPMIKIQAPNPRHLAHQSPLFQPTQPLGSIRLPFFHFKNIGRLSAHKVMFLVRLFVLVFFYPFFYLRTRNIIRNFVRPSVGPSVGPSIRPSMSTSRKVWKRAFPLLPTRPQLVLAVYPALFVYKFYWSSLNRLPTTSIRSKTSGYSWGSKNHVFIITVFQYSAFNS